jgi:hypothetical protein
MKTILKGFILIFLLVANHCIAQEIKTVRDIGLWSRIGLDYKVNKDWQFSAAQEVRTNNNASRIQKSITDFDLGYRINKKFDLSGGLRYAYNRERDNSFSHNIRYNLDFKFKTELAKNFDLQYRFRYQSNYENPFTGFSDFEQTSKARNRIKLEYDKKKHEPYFGAEIFRSFVYYRKPWFSSLRLTLGDKFDTKFGEFNLGMGYEREINLKFPLNFIFLRMNYSIEISND